MSDIDIRIEGCAGRITLTRPQALNALTYSMCTAIEDAIESWRDNIRVKMVIFDAEDDRAFCAGGDISKMYEVGMKGDFEYGRKFWRDEYRLNSKLFYYQKPIVSFMQGFVMGGGVGIGCHGSHRIVCADSKISMPECGIGLIPDVGGSLMLALAPGRLGEFLGTTGWRMGPEDAIYAGFADIYISRDLWPDLIRDLTDTGDLGSIERSSICIGTAPIEKQQRKIDALFDGEALRDIVNSLKTDNSDFAKTVLNTLSRVSPLSAACTIEIIHRLRTSNLTINKALEMEFRFTFRSMEHADFLEGIRAQVIDKDRNPQWQYTERDVPTVAVANMLQPLGSKKLDI